jgi:hypothetical protein
MICFFLCHSALQLKEGPRHGNWARKKDERHPGQKGRGKVSRLQMRGSNTENAANTSPQHCWNCQRTWQSCRAQDPQAKTVVFLYTDSELSEKEIA